jgi:hypothetical protein
MELIRDGWLKATVSSADGTVGKLTASAGRDSGVQLGEWIVLESHLELVDADDVLKVLNRVPRFRAYSAEQFSQDFEVVDPVAPNEDLNPKLERARPIAERAANGDVNLDPEPAAQG